LTILDMAIETTTRPVTVEPHWTGSEVSFLLHTSLGTVTVDGNDFHNLVREATKARDGATAFAAESKRLAHDPSAQGLVRQGDTYLRPDAIDGDPFLAWIPPRPGGMSVSSLDHEGRWEARLPLDVRRTPPPVGTADWNDGPAIADLVRQVLNPKITWGLYALAHTAVVAEHTQRTAEKAAEAARLAAQRDNEGRIRAAASRLVDTAGVTDDTLRTTLRAVGLGDRGQVRLRFESLPMNEYLLDAPGIAERIAYDAPTRNPSAVGWGLTGSKEHPVVGWRMILVTDRQHIYREAEQRDLGQEWDQRVAMALARRGLYTVRRVDGYWVVRDEDIFDIHHARWIDKGEIATFGMTKWRSGQSSREIDITKRGNYSD
jgi:hypothetical protein